MLIGYSHGLPAQHVSQVLFQAVKKRVPVTLRNRIIGFRPTILLKLFGVNLYLRIIFLRLNKDFWVGYGGQ